MAIEESEYDVLRDICKITGFDSWSEALRSMGFRHPDEVVAETKVGWSRIGSETYGLRLTLKSDEDELDLLIKACVAYSPTGSVEDILDKWVQRRHLLENHGVRAPTLYAVGNGCLIEQFVPISFKEQISLRAGRFQTLLQSSATLAGVIDGLKFKPVDGLSDCRVLRDRICFVDFGSDLGDPDASGKTEFKALKNLRKSLEKWGIALDKRENFAIQEAYDDALASI